MSRSALAEIMSTPSIAGFAFRGFEPTGVWPVIDGRLQVKHLTADTILAGGITVEVEVGDGSITIDGTTTQIVVNDGTRDRVIIGDLGADYGIEIYNTAGTLMWSATSGAQTAGIANDAVTSVKLLDSAVVENKLAALAVTTGKIAASAVTETKIGDDAISTRTIAANAVTAAEIAALTITADQIAANAIVAGKIAALAVETDKLAANAVTAAKIAANTITASEIAANAITADELAASSVTAGKIAAGAVTADTIGTGSLTASISIDSGLIRTTSSATDARAQMDTLGYGVYDSSNDRVIDLDENGLRFQTKTTASPSLDSIRWFRQGAGDSNPFAEVIANQAAGSAQIHVLARPRTAGQAASAIARLAAQDEAGNIRAKVDAFGSTDAAENQYVEIALKATDGTDQTRVKIDQDKIDLDSDFDGTTRGRIRVFKGAQGSGERITFDGHAMFNDGIIYPSSKEVAFGDIAAGVADTVAVTYDVAFTGASAPFPMTTIQDWDGTIRLSHGQGDDGSSTTRTTTGCDITVSNFASATTSTDVRIFVCPIGAS